MTRPHTRRVRSRTFIPLASGSASLINEENGPGREQIFITKIITGSNAGAVAGAAIAGMAVGAMVGAAASQPHYGYYGQPYGGYEYGYAPAYGEGYYGYGY